MHHLTASMRADSFAWVHEQLEKAQSAFEAAMTSEYDSGCAQHLREAFSALASLQGAPLARVPAPLQMLLNGITGGLNSEPLHAAAAVQLIREGLRRV